MECLRLDAPTKEGREEVRLGQGHDKVASPGPALISVDCPCRVVDSVRSAISKTPLRFSPMSEHAMGQACRLLTAMLLPFLQRWYRKDGKWCSRRETLSFELCTGLSLKEFGSLLNFLPNPSHATETPDDQAIPFISVFDLS
jgi:hypothetical protein